MDKYTSYFLSKLFNTFHSILDVYLYSYNLQTTPLYICNILFQISFCKNFIYILAKNGSNIIYDTAGIWLQMCKEKCIDWFWFRFIR